MSNTTTDPNEHTRKYLERYCQSDSKPKQAVLLDGPWGSGKTHFIKSFMKDNEDDTKFIYVSVYGMRDISSIEEIFFVHLHPRLGSKAGKAVRSLAHLLVKASLRVDLDGDGKSDLEASAGNQDKEHNLFDWLAKLPEYVLVFDDIERCLMPTDELFGYINGLVEHQRCRVILVANQSEVGELQEEIGASRTRFERIREKLIGETLTIASTPTSLLDALLSTVEDESISNEARRWLGSHRALLLRVHELSQTHNLRHLDTLVHALIGLRAALIQCESYKQKQQHWTQFEVELLEELSVFHYEFKSGVIAAEDVYHYRTGWIGAGWINLYHEGDDDARQRAFADWAKQRDCSAITLECFDNLHKRYGRDFFENDSTLDHNGWSHWVRFKHLDPELLDQLWNAWLAQRYPRVDVESAWLTIIEQRQVSEDDWVSAFEEVTERILNKQEHRVGVLLHVFGYLHNAEIMGVPPKQITKLTGNASTTILTFARSYVEECFTDDAMEFDLSGGTGFGIASGYAGQFYWARADNKFAEFADYFVTRVRYRQLDRRVQSILGDWENQLLSPENRSEIFSRLRYGAELGNTPIFSRLEAADFCEAVDTLDRSERVAIVGGLCSRYEFVDRARALALEEEFDFLEQIETWFRNVASDREHPTSLTYARVAGRIKKAKKKLLEHLPNRVEDKLAVEGSDSDPNEPSAAPSHLEEVAHESAQPIRDTTPPSKQSRLSEPETKPLPRAAGYVALGFAVAYKLWKGRPGR